MKKLLLGLAGLLIFGVLAGYGIGWYVQHSKQPLKRIPIVIEAELPARAVQLYFTAAQGTHLVPEMRQIPGCDEDAACIESLLQELIRGARQGGLAVLPEATEVLGVELENDLVRVDFSRHLVDFHPGGSLSELLTVYALTNSLAENFSYLRQLQILVNGQIRQTLKGHVRIDQPVYADFDFSHPPLPGPEAVIEIDPQQGQDGRNE